MTKGKTTVRMPRTRAGRTKIGTIPVDIMHSTGIPMLHEQHATFRARNGRDIKGTVSVADNFSALLFFPETAKGFYAIPLAPVVEAAVNKIAEHMKKGPRA
jgi:hypothetical protein